MPRSGSTYLLSLLNQHAEIRAYEELFLMRPVRNEMRWLAEGSPERFYDFRRKERGTRPQVLFRYFGLIERHDPASSAFGFKLMLAHARSLPEILLALRVFGYRMIFLQRRNLFEASVSALIKEQSGLAHSRKHEPVGRFTLDPVVLLTELRQRQRNLEIANGLLSLGMFKWIKVDYEGLCSSPAGECKRIFEFLGVGPGSSSASELKKLARKPYHEIIANYVQVRNTLEAAGLGAFLPEHEC